MMIKIGTVQTTASTLLERDQFRQYLASLMLGRYYQAKPTDNKIAGITIINSWPNAVSNSDRCSRQICPLGSNNAELQRLGNTEPVNNDNQRKLLLYLLGLI